jgi:DNA-binding GntR family transcriptional regulator
MVVSENLAPARESDRVAEDLRRMIINMELDPGSMVSESYLAELLDCGRTPLREAIQRLAEEYLVEPVPRRGIAIAGLSVVDLVDLIEALVLVEGHSARIACERFTDQEIAELAALVDRAEAAGHDSGFSTVAEIDFEFHHIIGRATGNRYLADTIARLHRLATRFGYVAWQRDRSAALSLSEHRAILAAFEQRDPDQAERITQEHSLKAKDRITASFQDSANRNHT